MLYISLALSGFLLVVAVLADRYAAKPVLAVILWAVGVFFAAAGLLMVVLPAVMLQAAVLVVGLLLAAAFDRGRQWAVPLAVISPLVAYGVVGWPAVEKYREHERLQAAYPFESIEDRLPRTVPASTPGDPARLSWLEEEIEVAARNRKHFLAALHADTTDRFVNAAGFGVGRMVRRDPTEHNLRPEPRDPAPDQPDYFRPAFGEWELDRVPRRPDPLAVGRLHEAGVLDFVNPKGFGFVRDRRHVAGFVSHGFSKVPAGEKEWEVARLELVGLLKHESPAVYLSEKLPRMDELKDAPTRALDEFEAKGLAALRGGEDLHLGEGPDAGRFLGAIRSTRQCVDCHGGERGALLGAFSYRLRPAR